MILNKEDMDTILVMYRIVYNYGRVTSIMANLAERTKKEKRKNDTKTMKENNDKRRE